MVKLENVTKHYGGRVALAPLSLEVAAGETFGLLGPNGAGKTTTIHLLAGLLAPDGGRVVVDGVEVTREPEAARRRIGYVSENVALYPYLTGLENLDTFARLAGQRLSAEALRAQLRRVGLAAEAIDRRSSTYSKGMRQKVGIAIAVAKGARVLLLDEPASGLDPHASHELSNLVRSLAAEGVATVMATHDLFRARETCDRVGLLVAGRLTVERRTAELSANELERLYLDEVRRHEAAA